jgi:hypothetical protein
VSTPPDPAPPEPAPPEPAPPAPRPPVPGATDVDQALALLADTVHQLMTRQDALHAAVGALTAAPRVPAAASSSSPDAPNVGQDAGEQTVPGPDGPVAAAPDTRTLDTEQTQQLLADLVDWVSWLTATFRLDADLPRCYARHPDLTEELLALRAARAAAYTTAAPPGRACSGSRSWTARVGGGSAGTPAAAPWAPTTLPAPTPTCAARPRPPPPPPQPGRPTGRPACPSPPPPRSCSGTPGRAAGADRQPARSITEHTEGEGS